MKKNYINQFCHLRGSGTAIISKRTNEPSTTFSRQQRDVVTCLQGVLSGRSIGDDISPCLIDGKETAETFCSAKDWELKGPQDEYYFLLTTYGARMAGMDKAGRLGEVQE